MNEGIDRLGKYKCERRYRSASSNHKNGPAKKKGNEIAIDQSQVFINTATFGGHAGQSRVGECAKEGDDASDYPCQQNVIFPDSRLRHRRDLLEYARSDHDARNEQNGRG